MTAWMLWAIAITALLATAAHILESVLRARGREGRWTWALAMVGAMAIQAWALLIASGRPQAVPGAQSGLPLENGPPDWWSGMTKGMPPVLEEVDSSVGILWLLASIVLVTGLVGGFWRLGRRARSWPRRQVAGYEILVSENFGPALLGILSPRIVLPRWLADQGDDDVGLVCLHEAEHRAARDTWLLAGAAFTVAVLPWNVALWWQLMRLRAAIELDCDKRVVQDGVVPSRYAGLLLSLGMGSEQLSVAIPAFVQPPTLLERRLTMLINGVSRKGPMATMASIAGIVLLTAVACRAPAPPLMTGASLEIADSTVLLGPHMQRVANALARPMIFVDGERIDDRDPGVALADFDPDSIESIEIIKGFAATTLYGAEASGGVIQIIMKKD